MDDHQPVPVAARLDVNSLKIEGCLFIAIASGCCFEISAGGMPDFAGLGSPESEASSVWLAGGPATFGMQSLEGAFVCAP